MITRPDEYGHQNPDLAFTDSDRVRGGRRVVADRAALYALARQADQLKAFVSIVYVEADADNGGAPTEVLLIDSSQVGLAAGWQVYGPPAQVAPAQLPARPFTDQVLVSIPYVGTTPPQARVFDSDGDRLVCQERVLPGNVLEFQFSSPTSGTIYF